MTRNLCLDWTTNFKKGEYRISSYKALPRIIPAFLIMPAPGILLFRWKWVISNNTRTLKTLQKNITRGSYMRKYGNSNVIPQNVWPNCMTMFTTMYCRGINFWSFVSHVPINLRWWYETKLTMVAILLQNTRLTNNLCKSHKISRSEFSFCTLLLI